MKAVSNATNSGRGLLGRNAVCVHLHFVLRNGVTTQLESLSPGKPHMMLPTLQFHNSFAKVVPYSRKRFKSETYCVSVHWVIALFENYTLIII
jgi:hypothetical protein